MKPFWIRATANWKTTSLGLATIIPLLVHLIFCLLHGTATEEVWIASLCGILPGLGLLFTPDASKSARQSDVEDLAATVQQHDEAIRTGNTSFATRPVEPVTTQKETT